VKKPLLSMLACATLVAPALLIATPAVAGGGGGDNGGNGNGEPVAPVTAGEPIALAEGLVAPLSFDVSADGVPYVSQNFAGLLTEVGAEGALTDIVTAPAGDEIGAVSTADGLVYFSQSAPDLSASTLNSVDVEGVVTEIADLRGYEEEANPDQDTTYGFVGLTEECAAEIPVDPMGPSPEPYTGIVDSHPYSTLVTDEGIYVADAGANAILLVDAEGVISTVAVLPPEPELTVTAELATALELPECTVDAGYIFEPVPTDVELGPDGYLYVTTLPGGPEGPLAGARGSVYRVDAATGVSEQVATGFAGATGLAVADNGTIFVAELFGGDEGTGRISYLAAGSDTPAVLIDIPAPAALEVRGDTLWATTSVLPPEGPAGPEEPTAPGEPTAPEEPTTPGAPTTPAEPTVPGEPTTPAEPTTPGEPAGPPATGALTEIPLTWAPPVDDGNGDNGNGDNGNGTDDGDDWGHGGKDWGHGGKDWGHDDKSWGHGGKDWGHDDKSWDHGDKDWGHANNAGHHG
jgi:hypothetical protein